MGIINRTKRLKFWILLPFLASFFSGCILPGRAQPTPLPSPVPTQAITQTPPPPTVTPIPTATFTAVPPPTRHCAIEWEWREEALSIRKVDLSRADGLVRNDKVILINGKLPLELILEEEGKLEGVSDPVQKRLQALDNILDHSILVLFVQHKTDPPYFYNLKPECEVN